MTSKFLLFTSAHYYPYGGMDDCKGVFDSAEEAVSHAVNSDTYSGTSNMHLLEIKNEWGPNNGPLVHAYDTDGIRVSTHPLSEYIENEDD